MTLFNNLNEALENLVSNNHNLKKLDENAKKISQRYRANNNDGNRLVTKSDEATAYALSRMPATYGAVLAVIEQVTKNNEFDINTVLDIGAGTGSATWALFDAIGTKKYLCLEREPEMIKIGKSLMESSQLHECVSWNTCNILEDELIQKSDLVITSYMINELPKEQIDKVIDKLWNATEKILIIIEPGTPKGFSNIKHIRSYLLEKKANIIAPCPHEEECKVKNDDWCQFSSRIQRSKVHKMLKSGDAPYEDEKYSYIAFSKQKVNRATNRILRHPIINKGFSEFKICTEEDIKNIKLSKKDGDVYKDSKKKSAGDSLNINKM